MSKTIDGLCYLDWPPASYESRKVVSKYDYIDSPLVRENRVMLFWRWNIYIGLFSRSLNEWQ